MNTTIMAQRQIRIDLFLCSKFCHVAIHCMYWRHNKMEFQGTRSMLERGPVAFANFPVSYPKLPLKSVLPPLSHLSLNCILHQTWGKSSFIYQTAGKQVLLGHRVLFQTMPNNVRLSVDAVTDRNKTKTLHLNPHGM